MAARAKLGLADDRADEISDVVTCPGAYSCNLGLTKSMGLGDALRQRAARRDRSPDPQSEDQRQRLPELLRPALGRRYRILRQRPQDRGQGSAVLSDAARRRPSSSSAWRCRAFRRGLAPVAVERVLEHFKENQQEGESFRAYVMRHKVETFRKLTADLVKAAGAPGDVSGLGRRRRVLVAARPRRVRGIRPA